MSFYDAGNFLLNGLITYGKRFYFNYSHFKVHSSGIIFVASLLFFVLGRQKFWYAGVFLLYGCYWVHIFKINSSETTL